MDVLESIRKRRFHRSFTSEPVDEESLARLVWAAGRAPMGGAELVRRILVVTDPDLMRTVRQVTPSFLANSPAVIVICTDLDRAEASMGVQGRDTLSLVDAHMFRPLRQRRRASGSPGHSQEREARHPRRRGTPRPDAYGSREEPACCHLPKRFRQDLESTHAPGSWSTTPAAAKTDASELFVNVLYLVASARDCIDEPLIYGPFRMIEGVSRMLEGAGGDVFLSQMKVEIDAQKYSVMGDRVSFARWLDALLRDFAAEAKRRNVGPAVPAAAVDGRGR